MAVQTAQETAQKIDRLHKRNQDIVKRRKDGDASLGTLAKKYGISRERVRQIAKAGGVDNERANALYAKKKSTARIKQAEEQADAIKMRYIMGQDIHEIARQLEITAPAAQHVLDEQLTDEIIAARSEWRLKKAFPNRLPGPKDTSEPRDDRRWTADNCLKALTDYAASTGGRLGSSTRYSIVAKDNDDLPSFPTIRNRLGRWSTVRLMVNDRLKAGNE